MCFRVPQFVPFRQSSWSRRFRHIISLAVSFSTFHRYHAYHDFRPWRATPNHSVIARQNQLFPTSHSIHALIIAIITFWPIGPYHILANRALGGPGGYQSPRLLVDTHRFCNNPSLSKTPSGSVVNAFSPRFLVDRGGAKQVKEGEQGT